jgi:peptide/nickel transport system substrate-binding protein
VREAIDLKIKGRISTTRLLGVAVALGLLATAWASGITAATASSAKTVTFAEQAGVAPYYIIPMQGDDFFSNANLSDFSQLLYLPLYWFGDNGKPVFNEALSIAKPPIFSSNNTVVTVNLKHWVWSNGTPITARDVIFWLNQLTSVTDPNSPAIGSSTAPGPGWAASVPGGFPQNVVSYTQTGTYSLVFDLNRSYNPTWFLYDQLSQIYPLPTASWDELSSAGPIGNYDASAEARTQLSGSSPATYVPSNPGTATSGALGVAQFLNTQSQDLATYDSNPLWKVVDGPFKLSQFTTSGFVKLVPNTLYSGSPKPSIGAFEELPFTSDSAEFNAVRAGKVTIGYIPTQDLSQKASIEKNENYSYDRWSVLGIDFFVYNFTGDKTGPVFSQLYFRQAMQSLVDQPQYIKDFMGGTGTVNNGPVPTFPSNGDVSPFLAKGQVYPYDPAKAVSLLKSHGWTVKPKGESFCSKPGTGAGECGAGIKQGQTASFKISFLTGSVQLTNIMDAMQSTMKSQAGIDLALNSESYGDLASEVFDGCGPSNPCNNWDLANYSTGDTWVYFPDYLPTGEELFYTGASANNGYYSSHTADVDITASNTAPNQSSETAALYKYEEYVAKDLPVLEVPNSAYQLTVYKSDLTGVVPQGIFAEIYPQDYRFKS